MALEEVNSSRRFIVKSKLKRKQLVDRERQKQQVEKEVEK